MKKVEREICLKDRSYVFWVSRYVAICALDYIKDPDVAFSEDVTLQERTEIISSLEAIKEYGSDYYFMSLSEINFFAELFSGLSHIYNERNGLK